MAPTQIVPSLISKLPQEVIEARLLGGFSLAIEEVRGQEAVDLVHGRDGRVVGNQPQDRWGGGSRVGLRIDFDWCVVVGFDCSGGFL